MSEYRKKQVVVQAAQWNQLGDHPSVKRSWNENSDHRCEHCGKAWGKHGEIKTLESGKGSQFVCPGDWIITGVKGENYPCKPDVFAQTYEPATPPREGNWDTPITNSEEEDAPLGFAGSPISVVRSGKVRQLERELNLWRQSSTNLAEQLRVAKELESAARAELAAVREQLATEQTDKHDRMAELLKDEARLDAIEHRMWFVEPVYALDRNGGFRVGKATDKGHAEHHGTTLREAIDQALRSKK